MPRAGNAQLADRLALFSAGPAASAFALRVRVEKLAAVGRNLHSPGQFLHLAWGARGETRGYPEIDNGRCQFSDSL